MKVRTKSIKQNLIIQDNLKPRKKSYQVKLQNKTKNNNQSFIKPPKSVNKEAEQTKKYLQKTLNILSHRFNIKNNENIQRSGSILNLSASVYKIVKENLSTLKKVDNYSKQNICPNEGLIRSVNKQYHSKIKDQIIKTQKQNGQKLKSNRDSRKIIISQKQNCKQRASSAMANYSILEASSICNQNSIIGYQNSIMCNQNSIIDLAPNPLTQNGIFVKRRSNSTLDSYFRDKFGTNAEDEQAVQKKLRVIKALKKSQQIVNKSNRSHIQSSMALTNCDFNDKSIVMQKLKNKKSQKLR